jgi:hypothetical protein
MTRKLKKWQAQGWKWGQMRTEAVNLAPEPFILRKLFPLPQDAEITVVNNFGPTRRDEYTSVHYNNLLLIRAGRCPGMSY